MAANDNLTSGVVSKAPLICGSRILQAIQHHIGFDYSCRIGVSKLEKEKVPGTFFFLYSYGRTCCAHPTAPMRTRPRRTWRRRAGSTAQRSRPMGRGWSWRFPSGATSTPLHPRFRTARPLPPALGPPAQHAEATLEPQTQESCRSLWGRSFLEFLDSFWGDAHSRPLRSPSPTRTPKLTY